MVRGPGGYKSPFLSICRKGFRGNTKELHHPLIQKINQLPVTFWTLRQTVSKTHFWLSLPYPKDARTVERREEERDESAVSFL